MQSADTHKQCSSTECVHTRAMDKQQKHKSSLCLALPKGKCGRNSTIEWHTSAPMVGAGHKGPTKSSSKSSD